MYISSDLTWSHHVDYICTKASKRLYALRTLKRAGTSSNDLVSVYCSSVRPIMEYACQVWHFAITNNLRDQLEQIQRIALKIIFPNYCYQESPVTANLITLFERRESLCYSLYRSALGPTNKLNCLLAEKKSHHYRLRNPRKFPIFKCRTKSREIIRGNIILRAK